MKTTESTRRKRAGRGLAAILLALSAVVPATLAASAAADVQPGDSVWIGAKQGYPGAGMFPLYAETPADIANPGEPDLWAYCIEHDVSARTGLDGVLGDYAAFPGSNNFTDPVIQARVYWTLTHAYPAASLADLEVAAGITGLSRNDAIEAAQYAIWNFTDLWSDPGTAWAWETPNSEAVYHYLVDGALAGAGSTPPAAQTVSVSVTGPATAGTAGTLVGPFLLATDQPTARVSADPAYTITDATGTAVDTNAVVDGQELYLDLRGVAAAGSTTVTATVDGATGTGLVVTVPAAAPGVHAQTIAVVAAQNATTDASAAVAWAAAAVPAIGTTLTDAADADKVLPSTGGTLVDRIAYTGLTPGIEYTVAGELMRKSDASATGIVGSTTFTPASADGTVDVTFTVPSGYAGQTLVAFEHLYAGATATGTPVASHADIDDASQTITVAAAPVVVGSPTTPGSSVGSGTGTGNGTGSALAATGGALPLGLATAAALAVIAGSALVIARRRRALTD